MLFQDQANILKKTFLMTFPTLKTFKSVIILVFIIILVLIIQKGFTLKIVIQYVSVDYKKKGEGRK